MIVKLYDKHENIIFENVKYINSQNDVVTVAFEDGGKVTISGVIGINVYNKEEL